MPWGRDEPLPMEELTAVAGTFRLGEIRASAWAGGYSNKNYLIETSEGEFLVKFLLNPRIDIDNEIIYLEYLKRTSFPASYYLPYQPGVFRSEIAGRHVVVQPRLKGLPPEKNAESCRDIAAHLACLHSLPTEGLPPTRSNLGASYVEDALTLAGSVFDAATLQPVTRAYQRLQSFPITRLPQSIVHGDATRHNTLFHAGRFVALVDWEEVGISASLMDLAMSMLSYCYRYREGTATLDTALQAAFLDGYTHVRPLTSLENDCLNEALQYMALIVSLWGLLQFGVYYPDPSLLDGWLHPALQ
ncbi:phosphotransferase [Ktedonospora formicarum]|uniref:Aminoglycoside phosphotransferase domain-containing protein n=1 Tax=Ktedonospora formicarum TaxID=2778364 RepID=A0A8J3I262_9CHLR|nr:phosphotransferase [Ktedonospora formicarum]GHO47954.1 hypothetical protein KSX_61170 [Ktedonospora formicarum]